MVGSPWVITQGLARGLRPFEPPEARAPAECAGSGLAPLHRDGRVVMAERRTVTTGVRVSPSPPARRPQPQPDRAPGQQRPPRSSPTWSPSSGRSPRWPQPFVEVSMDTEGPAPSILLAAFQYCTQDLCSFRWPLTPGVSAFTATVAIPRLMAVVDRRTSLSQLLGELLGR